MCIPGPLTGAGVLVPPTGGRVPGGRNGRAHGRGRGRTQPGRYEPRGHSRRAQAPLHAARTDAQQDAASGQPAHQQAARRPQGGAPPVQPAGKEHALLGGGGCTKKITVIKSLLASIIVLVQ